MSEHKNFEEIIGVITGAGIAIFHLHFSVELILIGAAKVVIGGFLVGAGAHLYKTISKKIFK